MFTLQPALDVRDQLRAVGVRADLDPAGVNPPGVWVRVPLLGGHTLGANRYDLELVLMVGDRDAERALEALVDLLNQVETNAGIAVTRAELVTVPIPGGQNLPAFVVPYPVSHPK